MTMARRIEAVHRALARDRGTTRPRGTTVNAFRDTRPANAVSTLSSPTRLLHPEAYVPSKDLYIERTRTQPGDATTACATRPPASLFRAARRLSSWPRFVLFGLCSRRPTTSARPDHQRGDVHRPRRGCATSSSFVQPYNAQRHQRSGVWHVSAFAGQPSMLPALCEETPSGV